MNDDVNYQTLAEFRFQIRTFLQFSERAARTYGLQPQQHQLLLALKGLPEGVAPTISTLAARLHLRHHTVVGLVDRLCDRGLLVRKSAAADARVVHLAVTRQGARLLQKLSIIHRDELQTAAPLLLKTLRKLIHEKSRD